MKSGRTLSELAAEVERQAKAKYDLIADTRELTLLNGTELHVAGGIGREFGVLPFAHRQIATHLGIPGQFYDRLQGQHPTILDGLVNPLFRAEPSQRMVRTLDGRARAFLSNKYHPRDNFELLESILPVLAQVPGVVFPTCEVTDSHLYVTALSPRTEAFIPRGHSFQTGDPTGNDGGPRVGDVVQAGVRIKNSEVGMGFTEVQGLVYTLICSNGAVTETGIRKMHAGRRIEVEEASEVYRDETIIADDRAFFLKVRDMVTAALDEARFRRAVDKLIATTTSTPIADPSAGVKVLANRYNLTDQEQGGILHHLTLGGDLTLYGLLNAVTRHAQDVESYDRSMELEEVGGGLVDVTRDVWREIATAVNA